MSAHTLEDEARAHITLARLLRKGRPPDRQDAVQKILKSDASTATKIAKIRRLDGTPADEGQEGAHEEERAATQSWQPLRYTLGKLKNIIKLPHTSASFLTFVFGEHRKIKDFGRRTHIFAPTIFLPVLRLDKAIPLFLTDSLQSWADRLNELLVPVLEHGWQFLTKRDYNMIVTLKKLCDEILAVNFRILNFRDRCLVDRLRNVEALFFVFYYGIGTTDRVVESISHVLLADGEHDEEAEEAELLVKSILFHGFSLPCLHDLLLGLNMMKFHRALTYADLIASDLGEIFNTARFICDPPVKERIDGSVEKLREAILALHKQRSRLREARDYLELREDGQPNDSPLERFYEFGESRFEGSYLRDRENVIRFVPLFLRKVDIAFAPLLMGRLRVEKSGQVAIFEPQLFLPQFDHFRRLGFKLEQLSFGYRVFSYRRYMAVRKEGKPTIAAEGEIIRFLEEVLSDFRSFGQKLASVLRHASETPGDHGPVPAIDEHTARQASLVLPCAGETIVSRGYLRGRTVRQALDLFVSLCYLLGAYLYDRELAELSESESSLDETIKTRLHTFERLAEEPLYREMVTQVLGEELAEGADATPSPAAAGPEALPL